MTNVLCGVITQNFFITGLCIKSGILMVSTHCLVINRRNGACVYDNVLPVSPKALITLFSRRGEEALFSLPGAMEAAVASVF
jgi:hypothetical protein